MKTSVLFICLGNICRSPAAEGIFRHMVRASNLSDQFHIDSAGTGGWHIGDSPDARMADHALQRGYDLSDLLARQIQTPHDFEKFDLLLTMDDSNYRNVLALDPLKRYHHKVKPMLSFCKIHDVKEVPDPYYRGPEGFEYVLDLLEDSCAGLLDHLQKIRGVLK